MLISVIIPTLNEAAHLALLIESLRAAERRAIEKRRANEAGAFIEIIVSDGGSVDATIEIARRLGARVVTGARGNRGAQMNAGAQLARGEILWFVHADARVHLQSVVCLQRACDDVRVAGGNFALRFGSDSRSARWVELIARVQRRRGVFYGDSGIWIGREAWRILRGFQAWPLFEDYDLARRLNRLARRRGWRTKYFVCPIIASSRRFQNQPARVLMWWLGLQILFSLGVSPHHLARWYRRLR